MVVAQTPHLPSSPAAREVPLVAWSPESSLQRRVPADPEHSDPHERDLQQLTRSWLTLSVASSQESGQSLGDTAEASAIAHSTGPRVERDGEYIMGACERFFGHSTVLWSWQRGFRGRYSAWCKPHWTGSSIFFPTFGITKC